MSRPLSLTIIAILSVLYGSLSLIPKLLFVIPSEQGALAHQLLEAMSSSGVVALPSRLHVAHGIAGSFVWMIAGIYLWKGRNWSRWLMLVWGMTVLLLTLSAYGYSGPFPLKCGTYLVLLYFLFRSRSSHYFAAIDSQRSA